LLPAEAGLRQPDGQAYDSDHKQHNGDDNLAGLGVARAGCSGLQGPLRQPVSLVTGSRGLHWSLQPRVHDLLGMLSVHVQGTSLRLLSMVRLLRGVGCTSQGQAVCGRLYEHGLLLELGEPAEQMRCG
jgi:hypothetical protein